MLPEHSGQFAKDPPPEPPGSLLIRSADDFAATFVELSCNGGDKSNERALERIAMDPFLESYNPTEQQGYVLRGLSAVINLCQRGALSPSEALPAMRVVLEIFQFDSVSSESLQKEMSFLKLAVLDAFENAHMNLFSDNIGIQELEFLDSAQTLITRLLFRGAFETEEEMLRLKTLADGILGSSEDLLSQVGFDDKNIGEGTLVGIRSGLTLAVLLKDQKLEEYSLKHFMHIDRILEELCSKIEEGRLDDKEALSNDEEEISLRNQLTDLSELRTLSLRAIAECQSGEGNIGLWQGLLQEQSDDYIVLEIALIGLLKSSSDLFSDQLFSILNEVADIQWRYSDSPESDEFQKGRSIMVMLASMLAFHPEVENLLHQIVHELDDSSRQDLSILCAALISQGDLRDGNLYEFGTNIPIPEQTLRSVFIEGCRS